MAIEARENTIEDNFVAALKRIDRGVDASLWATKPMTVQRGFLIGAFNSALPAVLVHMAQYQTTPLPQNQHDTNVQIAAHLIVDLDKAASVLHLLGRDVRLAVARDETLGGSVEYCYPTSYQPQVEAMDRMGFAIATLVFEARYVWSHSAP